MLTQRDKDKIALVEWALESIHDQAPTTIDEFVKNWCDSNPDRSRRCADSVGPVCTCEACGNYNPRYGNHCDALRIAFDDSEKCWARMSREKRMDIETAMAATAFNRHCDILYRKMTYWARHPIEEENEEK